MTDEQKRQCSEAVVPSGTYGAFHEHPCRIRATVERNGQWYCKKHDPVAVKERKDRHEKLWEQRWKHQRDRERIENAAIQCAPNLLKAVKLVLALNKMEPNVPPPEIGGEPWVVRLDPMAKKQLEDAVNTYEALIKE